MLDETHQKGITTEIHCILDLTSIGIRCLKPIDDSSRYDVVADLNGKFIRIQCKTSSWATDTAKSNTAFEIDVRSTTTNTKKTVRRKYTESDIDYFYTWFNGQGYMVSIKEATGATFRWRYEYPSHNQKQGIHIADRYKVEEVLRAI